MAAHRELEVIHRQFDLDPTTEHRETLNEAKQLLIAAYGRVKGEELMEKVRRVETAQGKHQYSESWSVVNEMCRRKRPKEGQVEGNTPEESVTPWLTHFRNLLGTHQDVEGVVGEDTCSSG